MKRLTSSASMLLAVALLAACGAAGRPSAAKTAGAVLAYAKANSEGVMQIWISRPDGANPRLLTNGDEPAVSPNGRYVAFVTGEYTRYPQLRVIPTAGGAAKTFGAGYGPLAWAPNSRFLAFDFAFVVDAESGKRLRTVTADEFAFSPDSKQIAYGHGASLWRVPVRGGKPVRLTGGLIRTWPVAWGKPGIAYFGSSSNHGADVWLSGVHPHETRQLTHGGALVPVAFSADGTRLLAFSGDPTTYPFTEQLWAVDVPSGRMKALTGEEQITPVGLSSGGASVLAIAGCRTRGASRTVETIPFAGGKPHVIVHGACSASWNAR